jgi:hypothetical protein
VVGREVNELQLMLNILISFQIWNAVRINNDQTLLNTCWNSRENTKCMFG